MIRFILQQKSKFDSGLEDQIVYTMDLDVPELQKELLKGGHGESTYLRVKLLAVEILPEKEESK